MDIMETLFSEHRRVFNTTGIPYWPEMLYRLLYLRVNPARRTAQQLNRAESRMMMRRRNMGDVIVRGTIFMVTV